MGLSNINNSNPIQQNQKPVNTNALNAVSVLVKGKEVQISRNRLKKVAKGLAKFAFLTGETNNEEEYSKEVEEDLMEALALLKKKRNKK